jgi:LysM repeat protein
MEQLTQIQQINSAIMFGSFTDTELSSILSAVQYAKAQLRKEKIRSFTKGDVVKFHSTKRGVTVTGTVTKVAIKYVTVKDGVMLWRVPANMLEAA